jgi:hypothetical protein
MPGRPFDRAEAQAVAKKMQNALPLGVAAPGGRLEKFCEALRLTITNSRACAS